ncbi:MAG: hypothetical protein KKE30_16595 [Gammaproteobacteria bacterium]|nr:hypothetical protein [Gammaproteobacteria bacterium]MBU1555940.1 hypothetical protein [Gammaproteobacteria bacterium]
MLHFTQLHSIQKFETLLLAANTLLGLSFSTLIASIVICYPMAESFSFNMQLISHVSIIFSATLVKIAYVGRCIAQYELHKEVR